jgi:hypothetical protein
VAGLYGTICPGGLADWSRITSVIQWHGLSSRRISTSWDSIVAALKRGHPVIVGNSYTPAGHILVVIGYTNNGHLIVNDPYGNRFAPGYGGTNGKGLFYRWSCLTAHVAMEVIGTYPPPQRPTRTPTPAPTSTVTVTVAATVTPTATDPAPAGGTSLPPAAPRANTSAALRFGPQARGLSPESPFIEVQERGDTAPGALAPGLSRSAGDAGEAAPAHQKDKNSTNPAILWGLLPGMAALGLFFILMGRQMAQPRPLRSVTVRDTPPEQ